MLETSVDLRSSQAWSQFDDAMTQFSGHGGGTEELHRDAAGDTPHTPGAESDEELSDSGEFPGHGPGAEVAHSRRHAFRMIDGDSVLASPLLLG